VRGGIAFGAGTSVLCKSAAYFFQQQQVYEQQQRLQVQQRQINRLRSENRSLQLTIKNQSTLLRDYDYMNNFAKRHGKKGASDFFYYLAEYRDQRFGHFARFLYKNLSSQDTVRVFSANFA